MVKAHNISDFSKHLAESVWLAALTVMPISTDLLAGRIFSDPKTALLEIFGILSATAIALSWITGDLRQKRHLARSAVLLPSLSAAAILAVSIVSWWWAIDPSRAGDIETVSSLSPRHLACQVALFLSVALFLRTREQLQRMVMAALAAGFAVGGFALLQAYGLQAPGYSVVEGMEITSFVGGPIFLAGYLLMLVPPAVWLLDLRLRESRGHLSYGVITACVVLLVLIGAFLACDKRGPSVAFLAAAGSGLVLLSSIKRRLRALIAAMAIMVIIGATLTGLAYLRKAGAPIDRIPYVERLAMIVPVGGETGDSYRSNLWRLLPDFMFGHEPILLPDGVNDTRHGLRLWLGYGPDNVQAVLPSKYLFLQAWPSEVMEVSSHSHFWDLSLNLGLAGLAAFFGLFFAVWYIGLRKVGAQPPPILWAIAAAFFCALLGGIATASMFHPGYFGIGAQFGFLGGLLLLALAPSQGTSVPLSRTAPEELFLVAMLCALAGHWIDLGFIFPTDENSTVFWVFAGAICGVQCQTGKCQTDFLSSGRPDRSVVWTTGIGSGIIVAGIHARVDLPSVLGGEAGIHGLFGGVSVSLVLGALALISIWATCRLFYPQENADMNNRLKTSCQHIIAVGLLYLAIVLWLARIMAWSPPTPQHPLLVDVWALHFPLIIVAGLGWTTLSIIPQVPKLHSFSRGAVAVLVLAVAGLLWQGPLRDLRSSISAGSIKCLPTARLWLQRSISLRPGQMRIYALLGRLLASEGFRRELDAEKQQDLLKAAERVFRQGMALSYFNLLSAKLGRLYLWRAFLTKDPRERSRLAQAAREALASAVNFAPQNEPAWIDRSLAERLLLHRPQIATEITRIADSITLAPPPYANVVEEQWGEYYTELAASAPADELRDSYAQRALMYLGLRLKETEAALAEIEPSIPMKKDHLETLASHARSLAYAGEANRLLGRPDQATALREKSEAAFHQLSLERGEESE